MDKYLSFRLYNLLTMMMLISGHKFFVEFEGIKGGNQDRVMWRSNASQEKSLLMYEGDSVIVEFCFSSRIKVSITNVRYSNDGGTDDFTIKIDGKLLGRVKTNVATNWGHAWNHFYNSGPIGDALTIHAGNHQLTMTVELSDNYGVELDSVEFFLVSVPSEDVYLCQRAVKEKMVFDDIRPPSMQYDQYGTHYLTKQVEEFECLEKPNVEMCLTSTQFKGVTLESNSEWLNKTGLQNKWRDHLAHETLCEPIYQTIWQIGIKDNSSKEFQSERPDIFLTYDVTDLIADNSIFPTNVKATFLQLNFRYYGAAAQYDKAYLSLGLVNPRRVIISVNMIDNQLPKKSVVLTKDSPVVSWEIPLSSLSTIMTNRILLTLTPIDSRINFDFLKLYVEKPFPSVTNVVISKDKFFELYGISADGNGPGMTVSTEYNWPQQKFSEITLLARKGSRTEFRKVLTIIADGRMHLYTLAEALTLNKTYPDVIARTSGLYVRPRGNGATVSNIVWDFKQQWINFTFTDNTKADFKFALVGDDTKLILQRFSLSPTAEQNKFVCYFNKHKHDGLSGLRDLTVNDDIDYTVAGEWLTLNGTMFWFDHENAFWYKQAGSDYIIKFPK